MSVRLAGFQHMNAALEHVVDGMSLQASNLHRLLSFSVQNACSFAEDRRGTYSAATVSEHVRGKNGSRRAYEVLGENLTNELRNIDLSWTSFYAGCVVT